MRLIHKMFDTHMLQPREGSLLKGPLLLTNQITRFSLEVEEYERAILLKFSENSFYVDFNVYKV